MSLTPADVHNVAFSKPPIGKRGYNEDEVDAFLDLVEAELARLIEENNDLRNQVEQLEAQTSNASAAPTQVTQATPTQATPTQATPTQATPTQVTPTQATPARPAASDVEDTRAIAPVPPPSLAEQTSPGASGGDHHVQAAKVLGLAQEMADRLTGEAKTEADGMLGDARTKSEQLLSEARAKADSMVNEARTRAETMLSDARSRAETIDRQAREKASSLERDAQRKHTEVIGAINQEKSSLEKKINELRTFEREYRTRLKTYLESQLRELDQRSSSAPAAETTGSNRTQQSYTASGFGARAEAGS